MNRLSEIFKEAQCQKTELEKFRNLLSPRSRYIIAMTPRSGSSFLCDTMTKSGRFGAPGEYLNQDFLPNILQTVPGKSPEEYFQNVMAWKRTPNGISGIKASWFQFNNFISVMNDRSCLNSINFIFLRRRNVYLQAVSLYKATSSNVFHTNIDNNEENLKKLSRLSYDYEKINEWLNHILRQEWGWKKYFYDNNIRPLHVEYEDLLEDLHFTIKRIAKHTDVLPQNVKLPTEPSVFQKISDQRNLEWATRFQLEHSKHSKTE